MAEPTVTAPSLRDRIAQAIECSDDEPYDEPEDVYLLNADAVLAVLADADPTDLGYEQIGMRNPRSGHVHPALVCTAVQSYAHRDCEPVYARPRPEETPDA